jgi:flagellar hook-associated protein 2
MGVVDQLGGRYSFASSVGVELQRDGRIQLNETKLRAAFEDDFDAVAKLFARSGSASDTRLAFGGALDVTEAGSYNVQITRAAELATATGSPYVAPGADEVFEIISGSKTVSVTIAGGSSLSAAVSAINSALAGAGVTTVAASDKGGALQLLESRYGSSVSFQVTNDDSFGLTGTHAGVDVAGTIDGQPATGSGQSLKSSVEDGPTEGFSVIVSATEAEVVAAGGTLALGGIAYSQGIAGRLSSFIDRAQAVKGPITTSGNHWNTRIDTVKKQMAGLEVRLGLKETNLRRQFAAMESALSKLASQGNWLAAQLGQQAKS